MVAVLKQQQTSFWNVFQIINSKCYGILYTDDTYRFIWVSLIAFSVPTKQMQWSCGCSVLVHKITTRSVDFDCNDAIISEKPQCMLMEAALPVEQRQLSQRIRLYENGVTLRQLFWRNWETTRGHSCLAFLVFGGKTQENLVKLWKESDKAMQN